jgi:hypothetical protein
MPIIKKYAETLTAPLTNYNTFLVDDNPNSTYFKVTEFADVFTGGKNGFLIEGSPYLKETTEIKIQILDVNGDPIYYEPGNGIPEYYEGLSKLIAVYVYEDTPIGEAKITILGEAKNYIDADGITQEIPDEWKSVYNLKWEKTFKVNRLLSNEDKVRFYKRPVVNITEIVKPIFSNVVAQKIQTGSVNGTSQTPVAGQSLLNYTSPTSYLLTTVGNTFWTASVVDTYLEFPNLSYRPLVTEIINDRQIIVQPPYYDEAQGSIAVVENFTNEGFTASFNYTEGVDNLKTALTGSFAKINITDLTTFVGDVARVKIFRKSQSDLADYQFIQEIQLESNELLIDLESQIKNQEFYGIFDKENFKSQYPTGYWVSSSNNLTTAFNQNYLFNSVKLDGNLSSNYYYTSKSFNLTENTEYTLGLNYRGNSTTVGQLGQLRVFISGSKDSVIGGDEQDIVTFKADSSAILQKQIASVNFKAENFTNSKLYFEVKGTGWHIADVSLRAAQETAYSPDEITFIQSVPRSLPVETFDYRFEFYDINNNYVPVLVEESKTFDGGNLQTIRKQLRLIASSAGFQFDSGSNPVPPTIITIEEEKTLLTGSVHYTSASFDFFGNALSSSQYTQSIYQQPIPLYSGSGQYPGVLQGIGTDNVFMRVQDFTGSRSDINVQLIKLTGECEGFTDTINIYKILDGFGGVNHIIRPFRGTQIRNSSTSSLEIQAVRIDGINDILLSKQSYKNFSDIQLHIISRSKNYELNPNLEPDRFVNLSYVTASNMIYGLTTGSVGTGQIDYNAVFNRDSIDFRRIIFLMPSSSAASGPAYAVSSSVLASIILEDLQDGLDSGKVLFNVDTFTINPRIENVFRPTFAFATASFAKRATAGENENITSSFQVYPSMSINKDWVPEYWLYYHTQSLDPTLTVVARDENKNIIPSQTPTGNVRSPLNQSKNLTLTFVYTEPWTSASVSIDKTFTIVPEGKQGDESIVFEVNPISITLGANSRGVINDFKPSITDIKLKQGASYLAFSSSAYTLNNLSTHGTFYIATSSIIEKNVKAGNVQFTSSFGVPYTASLIVSASSNMRELSGSIEYPLIIHPYFTSSIYTASVIVNYTKVLEGAPPIQILISPLSPSLISDEVGYVSNYAAANTTIQVKEGDDFLRFTTQSTDPGTWRINKVETSSSLNIWPIRTGSGTDFTSPTLFNTHGPSSSSFSTATLNFNRFDYPYVSANAIYTIQVYPFALGAGHLYTSSIFTRTQTFTKNVTPPKARSIDFKASSYTVTYDRNGRASLASQIPIILSATAFNTTASVLYPQNVFLYLYDIDPVDGSESGEQIIPGDSGTNPVTFTLPTVEYYDIGPDTTKTFKVKITDGNQYTSPTVNPYRAEAQLTISGIKAGADSYKLVSTNDNCSIAADLWTTTLTGTGMKLTAFNGIQQLTNVGVANFPAPNNPDDYDFEGNPIGVLGFSSASIFSKSGWITMADTKFPNTNPAEIGNITNWAYPATNKSGQIVYRVDFEGGKWPSTTPAPRQTQFVTQSISVQFTPPAPYDVKMTNENSSVVYKVAGSLSFDGTGTIIRAYRGDTELVNTNFSAGTGPDTDAYGTTGLFKEKCRVSIQSYSSGIITLGGGLGASSPVTGTPATMPNIIGWVNPTANPTAEIVYKIECEGRQEIIKTQSLSIQYEGNVGPGLVMRGEWDATKDYYGSVENINDRLDVVTYQATQDDTKYYAAISGSGPTTYVNPTTSTFYRGASPAAGFNLIGPQAPTPSTTQVPPVAYWRYLGTQDFFVAAKLAIFEKSFVKNSINVGTKPGALDDFANIVINGGRTDPYIALGQVGSTAGTAGTSGTSITGTGIIGYDRPGIFLGIYENGSSGTTGRFSIKTTSTSGKGMFWDGDTLTIVGAIRQVTPGVSEGSLRGAWASGYTYYANDIVSYAGQSWQCTSASSHVATNDTNATTGYPGSGPWVIAAAAGTSGTAGSGGTAGTAGTAGGPGPGVVYRGPWTEGVQYLRDPAAPALSTRRDVVKGSDGGYYLCKVTHTAAAGQVPTGGGSITGTPATYWESFGATFSSVATDILLAQDATITRGLVIGTDGLTNGFIRSTGASSLETGSAAGFYLQQDGKFRFGSNPDDVHFAAGSKPPFMSWNNVTLTIRGKIETDANSVSQIGDWEVSDGNFQHTSGQIVLDATLKEIKISDSSNVPRVFIKQGEVTVPSAGTTINISPQPSYDFGAGSTYTSMGSIDIEQETLDTVGVSVTTAGTYVLTSPSFGFDTITLDSDSNFTGGYASLYVAIECWNNPTRTGTNLLYYSLASTPGIYGPSETSNSSFNSGTFSVTFPTAGTYYFHTVTTLYGYIPYTATLTVSGELNPNTISPALQFAQTEVGRDGMIVLSNSTNFASIKRTTSEAIIKIATDGSYPGIEIGNTNVSATAQAIKVTGGDILCTGAGNNIMVYGGWIGTENTNTGGVRMGVNSGESCLIGSNFPSQTANVAAARLRIASPATKLGITGRELIWDSSSTLRIKTDIEDYPISAYDTIKKLKPILYLPLNVVNSTTYETNGEEDYSKTYPMIPNAKEYIGKQGGFIAEWLDEDPEMRRYVVYGMSDGKKQTDTINYDKIVVPLTKAVQILMDKVEALEAYISSSKI